METLETRLVPSCNIPTIAGGVLTLTCDNSGNTISLNTSGEGGEFPNTVITAAPFGSRIYYDSELNSMVINSGGGADTVNVLSLRKPATINGGGGLDNVNAGNGGSMQLIRQPLTVTNPPSGGYTALTLDDSADTANRTVSLNEASLTGLAPATINYHQGDLRQLNVRAGSGSNAFTVNNTPASGAPGGILTTINTGGGNDTVNVERTNGPLMVNLGGGTDISNVSPGARSLDNIQGAVTVRSGAGVDTLNVNDQANAADTTYTMTSGTVQRSGSALINYGGGINFVNVNGGHGHNTFNISGTESGYTTTLNTGPIGIGAFYHVNVESVSSGTFNLNVSSSINADVEVSPSAGNLNNIAGTLNIIGNNSAENHMLNIHDSNNASGQTYTLGATSLSRTGMAGVINFGTVAMTFLDLKGGRGADIYNVNGTSALGDTTVEINNSNNTVNVEATSRPLRIAAFGNGNDTVNISPTARNLNSIQGAIRVDGNSAVATLVVNDQNSIAAQTYNMTGTAINRTGAASISFFQMRTVTLNGGTGGNTFTVDNPSAGPEVDLNPGVGTNGSLTKNNTGLLVLTGVNNYAGATAINGGTLRVGSIKAVPSASAVTVAAGARFDLNNFNDIIGSLAGPAGSSVTLGTADLTTGVNNTSTTFSGVIRGSGNLVKQGLGEQTFNGDNTYTGTTTVARGTLLLNGSQPSSAVMVQSNSTLGGTGTVGAVTVLEGGTVRPGTSIPGALASASATFSGATSVRIRLNGSAPGAGYDQFNVTGAVGLNGKPLLVASLDSASAVGDTFTIVTSGGGGISGTFNGHPEGDIFPIGGARFRINYTANSVVLTHIAAPADHFLVSAPGSSTAGAPFDVTLTALDPQNNVDTTYTGTVTFTSSDGSAALPLDYTFQSADNGVHTFAGGATLFTAGSQDVTATDANSAIGGTVTVTVTPAAADHFGISAPAQATSGTPFDVTLTALDPYGNTDSNYQGTVTFTSSDTDPGVVLPADYTFTSGDGGVHTFTDTGLGETTLITLGDQTVTATDTASGITGTNTVTVGAAGSPQVHSPRSGTGLGAFSFPTTSPFQTSSSRSLSPTRAKAVRSTGMLPGSLESASTDRFFAESSEEPGRLILFRSEQSALNDWSEEGFLDLTRVSR